MRANRKHNGLVGLFSQRVDEISIFYLRVALQLVAIQAIIMHLVCIPSVFNDINSPMQALIAMSVRMVDAFYCTISVMYLVHVETHVFCPECVGKKGFSTLTTRCLCTYTKLGALTKSFTVGFLLRCFTSLVFLLKINATSVISHLVELCTLFYYTIISIIIPVPLPIKGVYLLIGLVPIVLISYKLSHYLAIVPIVIVVTSLSAAISYYFINFSRNGKFFSIVPTQQMLTILATQIMNLFLNALPSRLVPSIMSGNRVEPTVCMNVCFSYIAITESTAPSLAFGEKTGSDSQKIDGKTRSFMSRLNLYYCLLDFLSECIGVQKIKSTYTLYMVAAGLESILDINFKKCSTIFEEELLGGNAEASNLSLFGTVLQTPETQENERRFKQIATFCLAAKIAGKSLGFNVSAGITRGPIITGMLGQGQANCNFDVWGDIVNMAARIARGVNSGVFIKLDDFYDRSTDTLNNSSWHASHQGDTSAISYDGNQTFQHDTSPAMTQNEDLERKLQDVSKYLPSEDIVLPSRQVINDLPPCYIFGMSFPRIYKGKAGVTWITELLETDYLPWLLRRTFSSSYRKLLLSYISEDGQHVIGLSDSLVTYDKQAPMDTEESGLNKPKASKKTLTTHALFDSYERNLSLEQNDSLHIDNALVVVQQRKKLDSILQELSMYASSNYNAANASEFVPVREEHSKALKQVSTLTIAKSKSRIRPMPEPLRAAIENFTFMTAFYPDGSLQRLIYCVYTGDYSLLSHGGEMIDLRICFGLPRFISMVKVINQNTFGTGSVVPIKHSLHTPPIGSISCSHTLIEAHTDSSDDAQDVLTNSQLMIKTIYKNMNAGETSQFHKSCISSLFPEPPPRPNEHKHRTMSSVVPSSSQDLQLSMRNLAEEGGTVRRHFRRKPKMHNDLQVKDKELENPTNVVEEYFTVKPEIKPLDLSQALGSFHLSSFRLTDTVSTPRSMAMSQRHDFMDIPKVVVEKSMRKVLRSEQKSKMGFISSVSKSFLRIDEDPREEDDQLTDTERLMPFRGDLSHTSTAATLSREISVEEGEYSLASVTRQRVTTSSVELPTSAENTRSKLIHQIHDFTSSTTDENKPSTMMSFKDSTLIDMEHLSSMHIDDRLDDSTIYSTLPSSMDLQYSFRDLLPGVQAPSENLRAIRSKVAPIANITVLTPEDSHNMPVDTPIESAESPNTSISSEYAAYQQPQGEPVVATTTSSAPSTPPVSSGLDYTSKRMAKNSPLQFYQHSSETSSKASLFLGSTADSTGSLEPMRPQSTELGKMYNSKDTAQRSVSSLKGDLSVGSLMHSRSTGRSQSQLQSYIRTGPLMRTPQQHQLSTYHTVYQPAGVSADQRVQNFFTFFNTDTTSTPGKMNTPKNLMTLAPVQTEDTIHSQSSTRHSRSGSWLNAVKAPPFPMRNDLVPGCNQQPYTAAMNRTQSNLDSWNTPVRSGAPSKASDLSDHENSFEPSNFSSKRTVPSMETFLDGTENIDPSRSGDNEQSNISMYHNDYNDGHSIMSSYNDNRIKIGLFNYQLLLGFFSHVITRVRILFTLSFSVRKRCVDEIDFAFLVTGMMCQNNHFIDFFVLLLMYLSFIVVSTGANFNRGAVIFIFGTTIYFSNINIIYLIIIIINILWQIFFFIYLRHYKNVRKAVKVDLDKATERGENSNNLGRDLLFNNVVLVFRTITTFITVLSIYLVQCFYSLGFQATLNNSINEKPNIVAILIFIMVPLQFFYILTLLSATMNSVFFISFNFIALFVAVLLLITLSFGGQLETVIINLVMLIAVCVYSSIKLETYAEVLTWKASVANRIKIYKERLNPILPGMTIDVMIAANQPEAVSSTEGVFQFIESYMCDLNYLMPIEELENIAQIQKIDPCVITDTFDSQSAEIDFSFFKLEYKIVPNPSPYVSMKSDTGDGSTALIDTGKENRHHFNRFYYDLQHAIENRREQLYNGFLYNMHQYLHFNDPRYLPYDRPIVYFGHVGYLSLDIVNFTKLSSEHDVKSILRFLGDLFSEFDKRIDRAPQLKQIKSIGDAYEVMGLPGTLKKYGNVSKRRGQHTPQQKAEDQFLQLYDGLLLLVMAGFGFIEDCSDVCEKHFGNKVSYLGLRVGVCTGISFGSLLGSRQFRFDVFGRVPEDADSVQSEASTNTIFISKQVKDILEKGEHSWRMRFLEYQTEQEALGFQPLHIKDEHLSFEFVEHVKNSIVMYEVKSIVDAHKADCMEVFSPD